MIKILYNLLLSSMSLILLSCSKEDVSLFYDEVIGKIFVRVDQIESMNKSICCIFDPGWPVPQN